MKAGKWVKRIFGMALVVVLLAALCAPALAVGQSTTLPKAKGTPYVVAVSGLNVRSGPDISYPRKGVAPRGMRVYFQSVINGWWLVSDGKGHMGYVDKQFLSPVNAPSKGKYTVTAYVNVRSYPQTWATKVGWLGKGAKVKLVEHNGDWALIDYHGYTGYMAAKYLKK